VVTAGERPEQRQVVAEKLFTRSLVARAVAAQELSIAQRSG
jgi:hypothetical protein